MKFSLGLVVGFALGAGTAVLLRHLTDVLEEEDADRLRDRIAEQLELLEGRDTSHSRKS